MKINIKHSTGSYPVYIFKEQFQISINTYTKTVDRNVFLVVDSKVHKLYNYQLYKELRKDIKILGLYKIVANEKNKSITTLNKLLLSMKKQNCTKETLLISIGGGITGDISAFAASIYMRGIPYLNIPTTLLSMVDSSVGGKTGINFNSVKNLIGTYYHPEAVLIYPEFLKTLQNSEIQSGLGELIKYSFLTGLKNKTLNPINIERILHNDFSGINNLIAECIKFKSAIVANDEREVSGLRRILNFGHSFAHGIESSGNFKINHGNAVLFGIITSLFYSSRVKLINAELLLNSLKSLIFCTRFLYKSVNLINPEKVFLNMRLDKKNSANNINLVLLKNPGEIIVNYPAKRKTAIDSLTDMKVWVWESFKKETVEK